MKRFAHLLPFLLASVTLAACDDAEGDYPRRYSFVTEHTIDGMASDYFFSHDNGERFYPGDRSRISGFRAEEGRRAIIYYNLLGTEAPGYDYNVALYEIGHPRIGESVVRTEPLPDRPDNAPTALILDDLTTTRHWLNLGIGYRATDFDRHRFSLVLDTTSASAEGPEKDDYLTLDLHHASTETQGWDVTEFISFPLTPFAEALRGKRGILLRLQTFSGERVRRIELPSEGK